VLIARRNDRQFSDKDFWSALRHKRRHNTPFDTITIFIKTLIIFNDTTMMIEYHQKGNKNQKITTTIATKSMLSSLQQQQ